MKHEPIPALPNSGVNRRVYPRSPLHDLSMTCRFSGLRTYKEDLHSSAKYSSTQRTSLQSPHLAIKVGAKYPAACEGTPHCTAQLHAATRRVRNPPRAKCIRQSVKGGV